MSTFKGMSAVYSAIFQLMISCCICEIFTIKSRSCPKLCQKFDVFWL